MQWKVGGRRRRRRARRCTRNTIRFRFVNIHTVYVFSSIAVDVIVDICVWTRSASRCSLWIDICSMCTICPDCTTRKCFSNVFLHRAVPKRRKAENIPKAIFLTILAVPPPMDAM